MMGFVLLLGIFIQDPSCLACHRKAGTHTKDLRECRLCGARGGSCCIRFCCDARSFTCASCGKPYDGDWPEGGKIVEGIQITIKKGRKGEVVVKIANRTGQAWSRTNHAYSHGGFERHLYWEVAIGGKKATNRDRVVYMCPQVTSHTDRRGTMSLPARGARVFRLRGVPQGKEMEVTLRVTEFVLGISSNELKLKLRD